WLSANRGIRAVQEGTPWTALLVVGPSSAGRDRRAGALVLQRFRPYRPGLTVHADLKWRLSIFSALIFDSRVDDGTPRRAAAPNGPDTRPLLSLSAVSMTCFS